MNLLKDSEGRSPYWICQYRCADGRWLKKSTKQKDRKAAMEFCLALQRAEDSARKGVLTEARAKELIGEILERVTGEKPSSYTIAEWLDHWLEIKAKVRSQGTMKRYSEVVAGFIASLGSRANLALAHLTSKDVLRYRDGLLAHNRLGQTANTCVRIISSALNKAVKQQHIASNPALAVERVKERTAQKDVFTLPQIRKLLDAATDEWKGAILLGYYTGARITDVARMRWESIDIERKVIKFTVGKTGKEIEIPLHQSLEAALLKNPGVGKAHLFPTLADKRAGGGSGLSTQFGKIMENAGVAGVFRRQGGARSVSSLSFHSLRHSFNSALANADVPQEIRMVLTGHASVAMNRIYTHREIEPLRKAIGRLPTI